MKKIDVTQTITILANIGVIVGIAFLAVEISQSNRLARLQMRNDIAQTIVATSLTAGTDPIIPGLNLRARDPASLTPEEYWRLTRTTEATWRLRENLYYQYQNGLFDESEFSAESASWASSFDTPFGRDFYCRARGFFSQGFIDVVENMLSSTDCPNSE
jgi:hypothetical protein